MYYVYILSNYTNSTLYTGVTNSLQRRIYEHKNHIFKNSFTDKYNVNKLVYYEVCEDVRAAIEREKQIKSWNRKRKEKLIQKFNPKWIELYDKLV